MNKQELCELFGTTQSVIETNFPSFAVRQLKRGFLITRTGKGDNVDYTVTKTIPQTVDKSYFSKAKQEIGEDLLGEK